LINCWIYAEREVAMLAKSASLIYFGCAADFRENLFLTAFLFPILLAGIGTQALLYGLIVTSILGAVVTWLFRIETTGVKLDRLEP
jgi:hypothetical protein